MKTPLPQTPAPKCDAVKKAYQAPRVQVHGDVRTLTGSGVHGGLSDLALSRNSFS